MKKLPLYIGAMVMTGIICMLAYLHWFKPIEANATERVEVTFFDHYAQNNHNGFTFEQFGHLELYANSEGTFIIPYFLSYGRGNMDKLMERCDGETLFYVDFLQDGGEICQMSDEYGNIYITLEQYNALKQKLAKIKVLALGAILLLLALRFVRKYNVKSVKQWLACAAWFLTAITVVTIIICCISNNSEEKLQEYDVMFDYCFIEDRSNGFSIERNVNLTSPEIDDFIEIINFRQYGDMAYRLQNECDNKTKFHMTAYYHKKSFLPDYSRYIVVRLEDENGTVFMDNTRNYLKSQEKNSWNWDDFSGIFTLFLFLGCFVLLILKFIKHYEME